MTAKELRENRAKVVAEIRKMADSLHEGDKPREFTAEEQSRWKELNSECDSLKRQIDVAERCESLDAEMNAPVNPDVSRQVAITPTATGDDNRERAITVENRDAALRTWCRAQYGIDVADEERENAQRCGVRLDAREYQAKLYRRSQQALAEYRAGLDVGTATAGQETIPQGFVASLERSMLAFGGMLRVADIIRTDSGNALPWPTVNDTGNTGALLAEATTIGSTVDPVFSSVTFNAYKYSSKLVLVSAELLQDSAFDIAAMLGSMLGERLGRIQNTHFTTGTGSGQPNGIITAANTGVTAASATAITADETLDLVHSVDPAYRALPGVGFMFHDNIFLALRKLKDSNGQYIWQAGTTLGEPDRLWNYPITINQDMASAITTGQKTILFGALSKYKVRQVIGFRLRRLVERYADTDQEGFVAFVRSDGDLLDAGTDPVKLLVQL